ncbi:hypothetical protein BDN71DRAFT_1028871 [Pleurotus eryngii]|uniref:Uncharacterized protein n=1 Tax=Pleurotus eryngii TaxID=5323 RepID=A0A9P6DDC2_PLEER|nr:hypothetical protein BDN71DRAFT_1028871 [Pleurotus eryngii]
MVYRLPTHLESFVPPPSAQVPQSRPWRGALIISGMRASDKGSNQEIRITAVETDGDNTRSRMDLWPQQFFARIVHEQVILQDVQAWVRHNNPPLCTFIADRLRDPNGNTVNQTNFRSLSRILFDSQTIAIASWNTDKIEGAGMIIYPSQNSSALLVGALFLYAPFPDFIMNAAPLSPGIISPSPRHQYPQHAASSSGPYTSSSRHHQTSSSQRHATGHPASQSDPTNPGLRHDQYRYIMPRTVPSNYPGSSTSASDPTWSNVKGEEDPAYRASHTHYPSQ